MRARWVLLMLFLLARSIALCGERKDPFSEDIYHAPRLDGIVCDGDPGEWPEWLPWEAIDHFAVGCGSYCFSVECGGWNYAPEGPEDLSVRFKAGWGFTQDWPVLQLLVEWIDDEFHFDPEGTWNITDELQFAYGETLYDYEVPLSIDTGWSRLYGLNDDYAIRSMTVRLAEDWGIRILKESEGYVADQNQPLTRARWEAAEVTKRYVECQVQMFQNYLAGTPWEVEVGVSCLALHFKGVSDYDPGDLSFTYLAWGWPDCAEVDLDIRTSLGTIAFEPADYYAAVKTSTWGKVKSVF